MSLTIRQCLEARAAVLRAARAIRKERGQHDAFYLQMRQNARYWLERAKSLGYKA